MDLPEHAALEQHATRLAMEGAVHLSPTAGYALGKGDLRTTIGDASVQDNIIRMVIKHRVEDHMYLRGKPPGVDEAAEEAEASGACDARVDRCSSYPSIS